jgi:hypothetical protein
MHCTWQGRSAKSEQTAAENANHKCNCDVRWLGGGSTCSWQYQQQYKFCESWNQQVLESARTLHVLLVLQLVMLKAANAAAPFVCIAAEPLLA